METLTVILSSASPIKADVVKNIFAEYASQTNKKMVLHTYSTKLAQLPEQPFNSGKECAEHRNKFIKHLLNNEILKESIDILDIKYDFLVSIENSIDSDKIFSIYKDVCHVIIEDKYGNKFYTTSAKCGVDININKEWIEDKMLAAIREKIKIEGLNTERYTSLPITLGEVISKEHPEIDPKNWMADPRFGGISRTIQIESPLKSLIKSIESRHELVEHIIKVPNFPKMGVIFQDLSNILADGDLLQKLIIEMFTLITNEYSTQNYKHIKILGLDARGFIYGSLLAGKLNSGFVMVRKKGKLPGKTIEIEYETEYSTATIEIMPGIIQKDDTVIIVDDLIGTGGSLRAAMDLVEKCEAKVLCCLTILQVNNLFEKAQEKLRNIPIHVLLKQ